MKLEKYFVPMICPWCKKTMQLVNHSSKKHVVSCMICSECKDRLEAIPDNCILVVDDAWIEAPMQAANIPIYPFVRGIIVTTTSPPANVPHWEGKYAILPMTLAQMGFKAEVLSDMAKSDSPLILHENTTPPSLPFMVMRAGTC